MSYVSKITSAFGGVRPLARALGKPPSTVMGWYGRGTIPDEHKPEVLDAAERLGIPLTPADFFPLQDGAAQ